jgi:RNA polymerase sigma-70 factor (ECF subfamily)
MHSCSILNHPHTLRMATLTELHSPSVDGPDDITHAIRQAQKGDEECFRTLYRAVQPRLLRYLQALVGEDAEDVASDAWLQIARDLGSFHGDDAGFRGWAATIARNRAMDHLRRQRRRPVPAMSIEDLADRAGPEDTAGAAMEAMSTQAAIKLISTLPRDQAEAVLLRVVVGLDAKSAAEVLSKRPGAVRTAAYRGLRRLAQYLQEDGPGHAQGRDHPPIGPSGAAQ